MQLFDLKLCLGQIEAQSHCILTHHPRSARICIGVGARDLTLGPRKLEGKIARLLAQNLHQLPGLHRVLRNIWKGHTRIVSLARHSLHKYRCPTNEHLPNPSRPNS
jgi:hypothetical protein